jgi:hypothetical protein
MVDVVRYENTWVGQMQAEARQRRDDEDRRAILVSIFLLLVYSLESSLITTWSVAPRPYGPGPLYP